MSKFEELTNSEVPVLINFTATWCGPCKAMAPILDDVKKEIGSTGRIIKIDVDKNQQLASEHSISGVPTFMMFKNGEQLFRHSGMLDKATLLKLFKQFS